MKIKKTIYLCLMCLFVAHKVRHSQQRRRDGAAHEISRTRSARRVATTALPKTSRAVANTTHPKHSPACSPSHPPAQSPASHLSRTPTDHSSQPPTTSRHSTPLSCQRQN